MSVTQQSKKQTDSPQPPLNVHFKSAEGCAGHAESTDGDDQLAKNGDPNMHPTEPSVPTVTVGISKGDAIPSLLQLPLELRVEIYTWLCAATPITLILQDFARLREFAEATSEEGCPPLHAPSASCQALQRPSLCGLHVHNWALLCLNSQIRVEYARVVSREATVFLNIDHTNYTRANLWEEHSGHLPWICKCRIRIDNRDIGQGRELSSDQKAENALLIISHLKESLTAMTQLREITVVWLRDYSPSDDGDERGRRERYCWSLYRVLKAVRRMKSIRIALCIEENHDGTRGEDIEEWRFVKRRSARGRKDCWVPEHAHHYRWVDELGDLMEKV